jgi:hypothetical protein
LLLFSTEYQDSIVYEKKSEKSSPKVIYLVSKFVA